MLSTLSDVQSGKVFRCPLAESLRGLSSSAASFASSQVDGDLRTDDSSAALLDGSTAAAANGTEFAEALPSGRL